MKLLRLAITRAPKLVLAAGIVGTTTAIFLLWLAMRGGGTSGTGNAETGNGGNVAPSAEVPDFRTDEVVLCGNTLVHARSGIILAKQWLEGFGDAAPPIVKILPAEKLVICGNRGFAQGFGFDGKTKGELTFEGKSIGAAGFSFGDSRVLFVRDSNIWLGRVNWLQSTVVDAKRITSTNYFRPDCFRGEFFWNRETLLLPILGKSHRVDFVSGAVSQDQANAGVISRGASPDGMRSAVASAIGAFVVLDFAGGEAKQYPIRGKFREFLWLDETRLAYGSNQNEISLLDAVTGKVTALASPAAILKIAAASPRGESLMVGTNKGPMIFSTKSGAFVPVELPMDDGVWISEHEFLCTSSSTDTSLRGIWHVDASGSKELISSQPIDSNSASAGARPMIAVPGGAVWISGGNLWRYDCEGKTVSQVTLDQHLNPSLQLLK